jgi:putative FmdB family regulatory protein
MPIYSYRCAACGHAKDVLQKISDAPLTDCPACGAPRFEKQVTAAGFQLKGSGWYVTDFRDGAKKKTDKSAQADRNDDSGKTDKLPDSTREPATGTTAGQNNAERPSTPAGGEPGQASAGTSAPAAAPPPASPPAASS